MYIVGFCFVLISGIYFGLYYYIQNILFIGLGSISLLTIIGLTKRIRFAKYISYLLLLLVVASVVFNTLTVLRKLKSSSISTYINIGVMAIVIIICVYCIAAIHYRFREDIIQTKDSITA